MPPKKKSKSAPTPTDNAKTKKVPKQKAKWTSSDDATLIETLKIEQAKGNQADNGWKSSVWTACEKALAGTELKTNSGVKNAKGCQDRWSGQIRKKFASFQDLVKLSGWSYSSETHMIIATDEQWDTYIAAHKEAAVWRGVSYPLYDDILGLIEGRFATGDQAIHMPEMYDSSPPPDDLGFAGDESDAGFSSDGGKAASRAATPEPSQARDDQVPAKTPRPPPKQEDSFESSASLKKRKRITGPTAVLEVADAMRFMAASLRDDAQPESSNAGVVDVTSLRTPARRGRAIKQLTDDADLSQNESVQAITLFRRDPSIADTFLAIPNKDLRTAYIQDELSNA